MQTVSETQVFHRQSMDNEMEQIKVGLLGVSVRTLQDWEQGWREPSGAAKTLLRIAARTPDAVRAVA
jgi:DNA-binding transcriptional regulator YiaG